MSDLVEEMREAAEFGGYEHDCPDWQGLLRVGADEIERLRTLDARPVVYPVTWLDDGVERNAWSRNQLTGEIEPDPDGDPLYTTVDADA